MSTFADLIVEEAIRIHRNGTCVETSKNRGGCIDKIHLAFDGTINSDPYCAKTVYVVYDAACKRAGIPNRLAKTPGARAILDGSRKYFMVNDIPVYGCMFYHKPQIAGSTGHVGIVTAVLKEGIYTIDGNASNKVNWYLHSWEKVRSVSRGYEFLHIENVNVSGSQIAAAVASAGGSSVLSVIAGGLIIAGIGVYLTGNGNRVSAMFK